MNVSKSYFSETLLEGYIKSPVSLKEYAVTKVAIQLCQNVQLKNRILLSSRRSYDNNISNLNTTTQWEKTIDELSATLCKALLIPYTLHVELLVQIRWIARQLLTWSRKHRTLFRIQPEFTAEFLTSTDWTAEGRLKERQIAQRLVQDERISHYKRYKIACVYCLEPFIYVLWETILPQDRRHFCPLDNTWEPQLVGLWSSHLSNELDNSNLFWLYGFQSAIRKGRWTAVIHFWEGLSEITKEVVLIRAARDVVFCWKNRSFQFKPQPMKYFYLWLPSSANYVDILCFLLSQMNEEKRWIFFKNVMETNANVLELFLEWPYQEFFIPLVTKLWNMLHEGTYKQLFFALVSKYIETKEIYDYNYGGLLTDFFTQSPEPYKRYVFIRDQDGGYSIIQKLLFTMIEKKPIESRDIWILRHILKEATLEEKQSIIYSNMQFCQSIIQEGNLELINWMLTQCLPEEMINDFKRQFFQSDEGKFAYNKLIKYGSEKEANLFLEWGSLPT